MVRDTPLTDIEALALLDEPVRRRLYEWVAREDEPVSRDQAAAGVGIARGLAAFHLDRLADAGLVDTEFRRLSGRSGPGAGRPAKLYRMSARVVEVSLPARRYGLAAELMARAIEAESGDGGSGQSARECLAEIARREGVTLGATSRHASDIPAALLATLEDSGYRPVMDDQGAIRLRNCPFHALAAEHTELVCGMNLSLAQGIVEGLATSDVRADLDPQPGMCCVAFRPTDRLGPAQAAD
jgi:predicted ArsR family transcriptional regulator